MIRLIDERTGKILDASLTFNEFGLEDTISMVYQDEVEQGAEKHIAMVQLLSAYRRHLEGMSCLELINEKEECYSAIGTIEVTLYRNKSEYTEKDLFCKKAYVNMAVIISDILKRKAKNTIENMIKEE